MREHQRSGIGLVVGIYLVGFGMLAGVALDRIHGDYKRDQVLARYERDLQEWHRYRIELEKADARATAPQREAGVPLF